MRDNLIILAFIILVLLQESVMAAESYTLLPSVVTVSSTSEEDFPIVDEAGKTACIVYAESEYLGVKRAAADLAADIERVTGEKSDSN